MSNLSRDRNDPTDFKLVNFFSHYCISKTTVRSATEKCVLKSWHPYCKRTVRDGDKPKLKFWENLLATKNISSKPKSDKLLRR